MWAEDINNRSALPVRAGIRGCQLALRKPHKSVKMRRREKESTGSNLQQLHFPYTASLQLCGDAIVLFFQMQHFSHSEGINSQVYAGVTDASAEQVLFSYLWVILQIRKLFDPLE